MIQKFFSTTTQYVVWSKLSAKKITSKRVLLSFDDLIFLGWTGLPRWTDQSWTRLGWAVEKEREKKAKFHDPYLLIKKYISFLLAFSYLLDIIIIIHCTRPADKYLCCVVSETFFFSRSLLLLSLSLSPFHSFILNQFDDAPFIISPNTKC